MTLPIQASPVSRNVSANAPHLQVNPSGNLCTCQYGNRMCPENKNCECQNGYPICVD